LRRRLVAFGPAGPLVVVTMVVPLLGVSVLASTTSTWVPWFGDHWLAALWFVPLGAVMAAGALLPTHATSLVAGFLFGGWLGPVAAWLVIAIGSLLGHWLMTPMVGDRALRALADSPRALVVHQALLGRSRWRAIWLIALLRMSPVMPFATTNLLLAAFGVRGVVFFTATALGVTPRAIAVALIGAGLAELDMQRGGSQWLTVVAIVATVVMLVVVGRIAKAALRAELGRPEPAGGNG
jgi:uncharacterized membrane protein YdjX (TVP38/TMEM64 family)